MQWVDEFQRTLGLVCVLAAVPLLLFPHLIVSAFYSAESLPAASFAPLFIVAEVLVLLAGTYQALVLAVDHIAFHVAQNLLAQALLLSVAVSLLDGYGVVGDGLGWISAQVLLYAGSTAILGVRYGLRMTRRTALLTAFVVVSMAVSGLVGMANPGLTLEEVGLKVVTYGACVLSLSLFLAPSERLKIWRSLESLRAMVRE